MRIYHKLHKNPNKGKRATLIRNIGKRLTRRLRANPGPKSKPSQFRSRPYSPRAIMEEIFEFRERAQAFHGIEVKILKKVDMPGGGKGYLIEHPWFPINRSEGNRPRLKVRVCSAGRAEDIGAVSVVPLKSIGKLPKPVISRTKKHPGEATIQLTMPEEISEYCCLDKEPNLPVGKSYENGILLCMGERRMEPARIVRGSEGRLALYGDETSRIYRELERLETRELELIDQELSGGRIKEGLVSKARRKYLESDPLSFEHEDSRKELHSLEAELADIERKKERVEEKARKGKVKRPRPILSGATKMKKWERGVAGPRYALRLAGPTLATATELAGGGTTTRAGLEYRYGPEEAQRLADSERRMQEEIKFRRGGRESKKLVVKFDQRFIVPGTPLVGVVWDKTKKPVTSILKKADAEKRLRKRIPSGGKASETLRRELDRVEVGKSTDWFIFRNEDHKLVGGPWESRAAALAHERSRRPSFDKVRGMQVGHPTKYKWELYDGAGDLLEEGLTGQKTSAVRRIKELATDIMTPRSLKGMQVEIDPGGVKDSYIWKITSRKGVVLDIGATQGKNARARARETAAARKKEIIETNRLPFGGYEALTIEEARETPLSMPSLSLGETKLVQMIPAEGAGLLTKKEATARSSADLQDLLRWGLSSPQGIIAFKRDRRGYWYTMKTPDGRVVESPDPYPNMDAAMREALRMLRRMTNRHDWTAVENPRSNPQDNPKRRKRSLKKNPLIDDVKDVLAVPFVSRARRKREPVSVSELPQLQSQIERLAHNLDGKSAYDFGFTVGVLRGIDTCGITKTVERRRIRRNLEQQMLDALYGLSVSAPGRENPGRRRKAKSNPLLDDVKDILAVPFVSRARRKREPITAAQVPKVQSHIEQLAWRLDGKEAFDFGFTAGVLRGIDTCGVTKAVERRRIRRDLEQQMLDALYGLAVTAPGKESPY